MIIEKLQKQNQFNNINEELNISSEEEEQEKKEFVEYINAKVEFGNFVKDGENMRFHGKIEGLGFSNKHQKPVVIFWEYNLQTPDGCYITIPYEMQLSEEVVEIINKIRSYYQIWRKKWLERNY